MGYFTDWMFFVVHKFDISSYLSLRNFYIIPKKLPIIDLSNLPGNKKIDFHLTDNISILMKWIILLWYEMDNLTVVSTKQ